MSNNSELETRTHISRVNELLIGAAKELLDRAVVHDQSKLNDPEKSMFDLAQGTLKKLTYGSPEYSEGLKILGPALDHHYKHNSHHPQHYGDKGVDGMNLFDLLEMFFDWKAASERHDDADFNRSINISSERFEISDQLKSIFINTAKELKYID